MIRAHQPGSQPIDIPEVIPNPAVVPRQQPAPKEPAPKNPVNEPEKAWGDTMIRGIGTDELAAGGSGNRLVMRSPLGYTGTEPRQVMLKNSHFVDAKMELFAKYASTQWVKVGTYPIERQLLTE